MDRIEHASEPDSQGSGDQDGAEQAFEGLRSEVAALRRDVGLIYRQGQEAKAPAAGPDYSPTLGVIAKELKAVTARLDAMERSPALATTPAQQAFALRRELDHIQQNAWEEVARSKGQLDSTVREFRGMIASARESQDQKQWLWTVGACGAIVGMMLWFVLTTFLPGGGGTWLAGLAFGGRWAAGQAMMRDASPAEWDKMARLYKACPADTATELCEAAIAVRTVPPPQPLPRASRARR